MPEPTTDTGASPNANPASTNGAAPAQPPAIDMEKVTQAATAAAREAVLQAQKGQQSLSPEQVAQLIQQEQQKFIRRLAGQDEGPHPILRALASNPEQALGTVAEVTRAAVLEEVEKKIKTNNDALNARLSNEREAEKAFAQVLGKRPDITENEKADKLFRGQFALTDPNKPIAERMKDALSAYDLALEELGGGSAADRAAKAASVPSASVSPGSTSGTPQGKTQEQADTQWLQNKLARWRKQRNMT